MYFEYIVCFVSLVPRLPRYNTQEWKSWSCVLLFNVLWYISSHVQYHNYTVQWLSCRFDECVEGGESVLLDAFAVVEELREKQPHLFDTLARVPATFERIHYNRLVDPRTASYSSSYVLIFTNSVYNWIINLIGTKIFTDITTVLQSLLRPKQCFSHFLHLVLILTWNSSFM